MAGKAINILTYDVRCLIRRESDTHELRLAALNRKGRALERLKIKIFFHGESPICGRDAADPLLDILPFMPFTPKIDYLLHQR
jgi:hypothetical protein